MGRRDWWGSRFLWLMLSLRFCDFPPFFPKRRVFFSFSHLIFVKGLSVLIERHTTFPEEFLPEMERSKYSVIKGRLDSVQVCLPLFFFHIFYIGT